MVQSINTRFAPARPLARVYLCLTLSTASRACVNCSANTVPLIRRWQKARQTGSYLVLDAHLVQPIRRHVSRQTLWDRAGPVRGVEEEMRWWKYPRWLKIGNGNPRYRLSSLLATWRRLAKEGHGPGDTCVLGRGGDTLGSAELRHKLMPQIGICTIS